jgi:predicted peptidase
MPEPKANQTPMVFEKTISQTLKANYLLFLPEKYSPRPRGKRWPLILFLHGSGERGSDIWKVAVHGPPKIVKHKPDFPFIVVSPQCPDGEFWSNDVLIHLLDEIINTYRVDTRRVYLTGLSMGGYGTWNLGLAYPEKFAAIAPLCGGGEPIDVLLPGHRKARALKSLGVWAFHGRRDPVVPVEESERMMEAMERAGCTDLKRTIYPEAEHDSWTETYEKPALYDWFLAHRRGR